MLTEALRNSSQQEKTSLFTIFAAGLNTFFIAIRGEKTSCRVFPSPTVIAGNAVGHRVSASYACFADETFARYDFSGFVQSRSKGQSLNCIPTAPFLSIRSSESCTPNGT